MTTAVSAPFRTSGQIATELGVEVHRVTHAIKVRGIQPVHRARHYRLFDQQGVEQVRDALGLTSENAATS